MLLWVVCDAFAKVDRMSSGHRRRSSGGANYIIVHSRCQDMLPIATFSCLVVHIYQIMEYFHCSEIHFISILHAFPFQYLYPCISYAEGMDTVHVSRESHIAGKLTPLFGFIKWNPENGDNSGMHVSIWLPWFKSKFRLHLLVGVNKPALYMQPVPSFPRTRLYQCLSYISDIRTSRTKSKSIMLLMQWVS